MLFVYDEAGHLLGEYDATGNAIRQYVWLHDRPVAMLTPNGSGTDVYFIHSDHLNTPKVITDENQSVVWKADYRPFGEVTETVSTIDMPLRFAGQYFDEETGLHQNWKRDYAPDVGRYLESDPLGIYGGLNTYAYVGNNPLSYVDPTGMVRWKGSYFTLGAGYKGFTGQYFRFLLTSECVDGKQALIYVNAYGIGFGAGGLPVELGGGTLDFDDGRSTLDPFVFNGGFRADMAGGALGMGYGFTGFVLGGVVVGGWGTQGGIDLLSAAVLAGKSEVSEPVAYFDCDEGCE